MLLQQYRAGYGLALALVARGGVPALDAALADPPLSSEEVLHPERYLGGRRPLAWLALPDPPAGCTRRAANRLGELGVRVWLREAGVDPAQAGAAADGWDSDRAVLWSCRGGRPSRG